MRFLLFPFSEKHQTASGHDLRAAGLPRHVDSHLQRSQGRQKSTAAASQFDSSAPVFGSQPFFFYLQNGVFLFLQSQAAKSSSDSDDVAETDKDEDGEEGKPEQDETEKEKEEKEKEQTEPPPEEDTKKHGFLILSREDSTMVDGRLLCSRCLRCVCVVMWMR